MPVGTRAHDQRIAGMLAVNRFPDLKLYIRRERGLFDCGIGLEHRRGIERLTACGHKHRARRVPEFHTEIAQRIFPLGTQPHHQQHACNGGDHGGGRHASDPLYLIPMDQRGGEGLVTER
jgi:hypothetical protein